MTEGKGCGAHHKAGQELLRAALRFAREFLRSGRQKVCAVRQFA
jgi:hypothetical protein